MKNSALPAARYFQGEYNFTRSAENDEIFDLQRILALKLARKEKFKSLD